MEHLEWILSIAGTVLSLVILCVSFLIKLLQSIRARKREQGQTTLLDAVAPIVEIAEAFEGYSGEEKKEYVITKVNQFAIENGIEFNLEVVSKKIEELIELSKKVNKRENAE